MWGTGPEACAKVAAKYYYSSLSPEAGNADLEGVDCSPNSFRSAKRSMHPISHTIV